MRALKLLKDTTVCQGPGNDKIAGHTGPQGAKKKKNRASASSCASTQRRSGRSAFATRPDRLDNTSHVGDDNPLICAFQVIPGPAAFKRSSTGADPRRCCRSNRGAGAKRIADMLAPAWPQEKLWAIGHLRVICEDRARDHNTNPKSRSTPPKCSKHESARAHNEKCSTSRRAMLNTIRMITQTRPPKAGYGSCSRC